MLFSTYRLILARSSQTFFQFCLLSCVWKQREIEYIHPSSAILFYSSRQWIGYGHPHWRDALVSLSMQVLIFSGNTLIDTTGNNGLLARWASLSSVKMAHKINHHNHVYTVLRHCKMHYCFNSASWLKRKKTELNSPFINTNVWRICLKIES